MAYKTFYRFNGNGNDTVGSNDLSLIGNGVSYSASQSAILDGSANAYLKTPANNFLDGFSSGTISFLMKLGSLDSFRVFLSYSTDQSPSSFIFFGLSNSNLYCSWKSDSQGDTLSWTGSTTFTTNKLYHIVLKYDGSSVQAYINGVQEVLTGNLTGWFNNFYGVTSLDNYLILGAFARQSTPPGYNLNGEIDEFIIDSSVWTLAQIKNYYTYTKGMF